MKGSNDKLLEFFRHPSLVARHDDALAHAPYADALHADRSLQCELVHALG